MLAIFGALGAAACYGVGSVLQAVAAGRSAQGAGLDPRLLIRLGRQWRYLVGVALDAVGFLASIAALRTLPLFFVESAVAASVGVTALVAVVVLHVRLAGREIAALAGLGVGLSLLALAAQADSGRPLTTSGQWVVLAGVVVLLGLGLWVARLRGAAAAAGLAVCAGLGFAGVGIAARAIVIPTPFWQLVTHPLAWAIAGYGALGMLLFATALQRGSVTTASALTFAVETVVPAAIGSALLGDQARPGFGGVAVIGFVVTLGSAVLLARYADPGQGG